MMLSREALLFVIPASVFFSCSIYLSCQTVRSLVTESTMPTSSLPETSGIFSTFKTKRSNSSIKSSSWGAVSRACLASTIISFTAYRPFSISALRDWFSASCFYMSSSLPSRLFSRLSLLAIDSRTFETPSSLSRVVASRAVLSA